MFIDLGRIFCRHEPTALFNSLNRYPFSLLAGALARDVQLQSSCPDEPTPVMLPRAGFEGRA
jgi:hypothetical protein